MKKRQLILLICMALATITNAQKLSQWQLRRVDAPINLNPPPFETSQTTVSSRSGGERLPIVYEYASVPAKNDKKWVLAAVDSKGKVNFAEKSRLDNKNYDNFTKQIDITYFRAFLDLRGVTDAARVKSVVVSIGQVDDQARMLVYNNKEAKYVNGFFVGGTDAKRGGQPVIVDFSQHIALNQLNTLVIVQVDDNCCGNNLIGGITVKINDAEILPDPKALTTIDLTTTDYAEDKPVPLNIAKFNVNAFSVNQGQGQGLWFFGVNNGDNTARIIQKNTPNTTLLDINSVVVNAQANIYAFKVSNYPPDPEKKGRNAYLVANPVPNQTAKIQYLDDSKGAASLPAGAQFISLPAFTKTLGAATFSSFESKVRDTAGNRLFLRHRGYILFIDPEHPSELFNQDASWKIIAK